MFGGQNLCDLWDMAVSSKVDYPGFCDMESTPSARQLCTIPSRETQVSSPRESQAMQRTEGRYSEPQTCTLTQWDSIHQLSKQIIKFHQYRAQISALSTLTHLTFYTFQKRGRSPLPTWWPAEWILGVWATATGKSKPHRTKWGWEACP